MSASDESSERLRVELDALYADRPTPPELEHRVVADLVDAGWLGPQRGAPTARPRPGWRTWSMRAAAALVLFAAGFAVGRRPEAVTAGAQADFMLLLWEGPGFATAADPGEIAREYAEWASSGPGRDRVLSGSELGPDQIFLAAGGPTEAPPPGTRLGGYFLIGASDPAEARSLAEGHPHVGHGGWVELAPLVRR